MHDETPWLDGNRPLPVDREALGRLVREAWVRWAQTQPDPKPSWLVPYEQLQECDKEADRQIGETIARWTLILDASAHSSTEAPAQCAPTDPLTDLVERFSKALLAKLRIAEANGRSGWDRDDWEKQCQEGLLRHVDKGDPRDVAAYCAFMWHHGWITALPSTDGGDA